MKIETYSTWTFCVAVIEFISRLSTEDVRSPQLHWLNGNYCYPARKKRPYGYGLWNGLMIRFSAQGIIDE
jgi:hypothetical protein